MAPETKRRIRCEAGHNLVEVALITPLVLLVALNAVNFGYYFFVALNLTSAPRHAVEYAIQGQSTPSAMSYPDAGPSGTLTSVSALAYADIQNSLPSYSNARVQVCSSTVGTLVHPGTTTQTAPCCVTTSNSSTCSTGTGFPAPASDPESPYFVLNRVDISYTVAPLVSGNVFGIKLLPSFTFHEQVSMRAM